MKSLNKNQLALLTCVIALSLSETAQASATALSPSSPSTSYSQLSNKVMAISNARIDKQLNQEIDKVNDVMATRVLAKIGDFSSY